MIPWSSICNASRFSEQCWRFLYTHNIREYPLTVTKKVRFHTWIEVIFGGIFIMSVYLLTTTKTNTLIYKLNWFILLSCCYTAPFNKIDYNGQSLQPSLPVWNISDGCFEMRKCWVSDKILAGSTENFI